MSEKMREEINEENTVAAEAGEAGSLDPSAVYESAADGSPVEGDSADAAVTVDADAPTAEEELIENLREQLAAAETRADETLDKLQRTAAEFQNIRRRQERQLADEIDRANGTLIRRLLPIADDFDLAFQNVPLKLEVDAETSDEKAQSAWIDGFRQIRKKLGDVLTEEGVALIEPEGAFDPMLHEAIASVESEDVPSGHIVDVLRSGYTHKGKVLRPALVRVAV